MDFEDLGLLRKTAEAYCVANVFDWVSLGDEMQGSYIENTMKLFMENKEVLKRFFNIQMN